MAFDDADVRELLDHFGGVAVQCRGCLGGDSASVHRPRIGFALDEEIRGSVPARKSVLERLEVGIDGGEHLRLGLSEFGGPHCCGVSAISTVSAVSSAFVLGLRTV